MPYIGVLVEKILGLAFALLIAFLFGAFGVLLLEISIWANQTWEPPELVFAPQVGVGFLLLFLFGFLAAGSILVSAGRLLLWLRDGVVAIWTRYTPRYLTTEINADQSPWPPFDDEVEIAKRRAMIFAEIGIIMFAFFTTFLVGLEILFPDRLHGIIYSLYPSWIADYIDATLVIVDIAEITGSTNLFTDPVTAVGYLFIAVIPTIPFLFASRNLLLCTETASYRFIKENSDSWMGQLRIITLLFLSVFFLSAYLFAIIAML